MDVQQIKETLERIPKDFELVGLEVADSLWEFRKAEAEYEIQYAKTYEMYSVNFPKDSPTLLKSKTIQALSVKKFEVIEAEITYEALKVKHKALDKQIQTLKNLCNKSVSEDYAGGSVHKMESRQQRF